MHFKKLDPTRPAEFAYNSNPTRPVDGPDPCPALSYQQLMGLNLGHVTTNGAVNDLVYSITRNSF